MEKALADGAALIIIQQTGLGKASVENTLVKSEFTLDKLSPRCYFLLVESVLHFVQKCQKNPLFLYIMTVY